jgi:hypothetical protein
MTRLLLSLLLLSASPPVLAQGALPDSASARQVVDWAVDRAGGKAWLHATSNRMEGWAVPCRQGRAEQCIRPDRNVMHRKYPKDARSAEASAFGFSAIRCTDAPRFTLERLVDDEAEGWHERVHSDFYWVPDPGFLQPGRVRLYYAGAEDVYIRWTSATLNETYDDALFALGAVND